MCGITGLLGRADVATDDLRDALARMTDALEHRGPDDAGTWIEPQAGVALGHRRLSIIDLSPGGHQPMGSSCGRYVVVFNGEIYNFREIRGELEQAGHPFRSHSDTEVLLAAVSAWGLEAALARFNGMFAFALWDRAERVLHLVRDRLGEKPLYYGWCGEVLLFGSELKALRAHPGFTAEVDREALALYFRYGYIPAPRSIYRGIHKLPPASRVALRADDWSRPVAPVSYWSVRDAAERGAGTRLRENDPSLVERLDELLRDAVRLRMEADVPLGAFLSGGIDSSTIVALMQAQSPRAVQTFTIGFGEADYDEARHARAVAKHLGTSHTELYLTPEETLAVIPRLPTLYDEPFADSSQIPTHLVAQLARRHVTVALSGDGGDELFGGYNRHLWGAGVWSRAAALPAPLRRLAAGMLQAGSSAAWERAFQLLRPVLPARLTHRQSAQKVQKLARMLSASGEREAYSQLVSHWEDGLVVGTGDLRPLAGAPAWLTLGPLAEEMMYLDTVMYLPDDILVKVDRATMGASLEGRIPFLDPRVVEFAWRLPLGSKIRDGQGKYLLREVLYRYVPRELIERPKSGFAVPIDGWLRGPLRQWAEELLDEHRLRREGFLDPVRVRRHWREHLSGTRNWQQHLWDVLMFQAWLESTHRPAASAGGVPVLA